MRIEDLKVGDKYRWVGCTGFILTSGKEYVISEVLDGVGYVINDQGNRSELSVNDFEKIEPENQQYTFDDLIDAAVQAWKDGVTKSITLVDGVLCVSEDHLSDAIVAVGDKASSQFYSDAIKAIKALYKETFVIESEEDIKRIKENATVTLANGEMVYFADEDNGHYYFNFDSAYPRSFPFIALKGATVEQERGRDD